MIIGVPTEIKNNENRVSMLPFGVEDLVRNGNRVLVQESAGSRSGIQDEEYIKAGAEIVKSAKDIFNRSEMIVKVKEPQPVELKMIKNNQIIFTYLHFAADKKLTKGFIQTKAIGIAYETVQLENGQLPLLIPMSEVAGRMAIQNGAKALEANMGGRGLLLSGVPGVSPATVTIIGGGVVGLNAAKVASGLGAKVNILDVNPTRLKYLDDIMPENVFTIYSNRHNIIDLLPKTDLLIGAVLIPGSKAPNLVNKKMLALMKKGSVIVDVAVDQGGCVETCKPTTHEKPIYEVDGIIHYCVANMPGAVPYTSTTALTNVTFPYIKQIAQIGYKAAMRENSSLLSGLNSINGNITHKGVAEAFGIKYISPDKYIK
ncbi:MAG: alanine dehydrogenase [Candidatus Neomarinimicrobiota bacterium]|nr:alanine dehydrogenase [Candidatus Neomarinimicrobiota bacterium]